MQPLTLKEYLLLGLISLIAAGCITPIMRFIANRYGIVDRPSEAHKTHKSPVPYLGGVGIVIVVVGVTIAATLASDLHGDVLIFSSSLLGPAVIMGVVGLIDDLKSSSPWFRFIAQCSLGIVISGFLVTTGTLGNPTGIKLLDISLTTLWIVGITNSVNFFDNIDGGASGAIAIVSIFLAFLSWHSGQIQLVILSIVIAGATLGFLIWNRPPARIYMGDAGALFLGILIASLAIRLEPKTNYRVESFAILFLLLALPILDTTIAITSRLKRRVSPFKGGRDHLSHRLMMIGLSKQNSIFILWTATAFFASIAVVISNTSKSVSLFVTASAGIIWLLFYFWFYRLAEEKN